MMHEEWILEAQIALGTIASLVRQGESGQPLSDAIFSLKLLVRHWSTWTDSDDAGRLFAAQCAEDEGVFAALEVEAR